MKFSMSALEQKFQNINNLLRGYDVELKGLSFEDM